MTITRFRIVDSPVGPLTVAGTGTVLTHLRMRDQTHPPAGRDNWVRDHSILPQVVEQLGEYFDGEREHFDVELLLDGTAFQRQVWRALVDIPYGETESYGQLAMRIDRPGASRAVGLANGRNPIAIIVPCHRVIGASGSLTGYGGGLDNKRTLLDLERNQRQPRLDVFG